MLELTSMIWEGTDYVPQVWDRWLADRDGRLAVGEFEGKVVGLGNVSRGKDGVWWLNGLRVHPEYEGRGVARQLFDYLVGFWEEGGNGALRLTTMEDSVKHMCAGAGFGEVEGFSFYRAECLDEALDGMERVGPKEAENLLAEMMAVNIPAMRWIDVGWKWVRPTAEVFAKTLVEEAGYRLASGDLLAGRGDIDENGEMYLLVWLICPAERLAENLINVRRLGAQRGYRQAAWVASRPVVRSGALEKAGYWPGWEMEFSIFEKKHPGRGLAGVEGMV